MIFRGSLPMPAKSRPSWMRGLWIRVLGTGISMMFGSGRSVSIPIAHGSRWRLTSKLKPTVGWGDRACPFGTTNRNLPQSWGGTALTSTPGAHGANVTSVPMTMDASSVARSTQGTPGAIEAPKHKSGSSTTVPPTQTPQQLPTPVRVETLSKLLEGYHDAEYLVQGFSCGFKIDFEGPDVPLSAHNSSSAQHHSGVVSNKLTKEIELGRISGPLQEVPFKNFKCSPLSVREKQIPGTYRLLHNLSYPYDESAVNFNIPKEASHVQYASIDDAFQLIRDHSPAAFMAKSDIKDAFRLIPIHPSDYHLMGFMWQNQYYYDKCLPMGCSTSCKIFERFSSALRWILKEKLGVTHVTKILDDFFFTGPSYASCLHSLHTFRALCDQLGIPLAEEKTVGPTKQIVFLGIELDSVAMIARLPIDKLHNYSEEVQHLATQRKVTLRDLKSTIGKLQFACTVVQSGRAFLRRLYDHTIGIQKPFHFIHVSRAMKADLQMWSTFLSQFNGKAFMHATPTTHSNAIHLYTDASHLGYGGTFGTNWIQGTWPEDWLVYSIQVLELYPILLLVATFAEKMGGSHIVFHTDNQAIVAVLNKQTSKCPRIMAILRPLVLLLL